MAKFRVDSEVLLAKSGEVRGLKDEHIAVIDRLTSLVNGLDEIWEGQAQQAFVQSYTDMKVKFDEFVELLESYAEDLEKDSKIYAQAEADATSNTRA